MNRKYFLIVIAFLIACLPGAIVIADKISEKLVGWLSGILIATVTIAFVLVLSELYAILMRIIKKA